MWVLTISNDILEHTKIAMLFSSKQEAINKMKEEFYHISQIYKLATRYEMNVFETHLHENDGLAIIGVTYTVPYLGKQKIVKRFIIMNVIKVWDYRTKIEEREEEK